MNQLRHMTQNLLDIKGANDFGDAFDVSRETLERLQVYADLLSVWQKSKNLVANKTLEVMWLRHFADSAQIFPHIAENSQVFYDFGSGAGFPGLVLAILLAEKSVGSAGADKKIVKMYESNGRKCAFLHEVVRKTEISRQYHCGNPQQPN